MISSLRVRAEASYNIKRESGLGVVDQGLAKLELGNGVESLYMPKYQTGLSA
jgi:hypothetical protein